MIVEKSDFIPTKVILKEIGEVSTKIKERSLGSKEDVATRELIRQAKGMRADAIINFSQGKRNSRSKITIYQGLAVTTKDIAKIQEILDLDVCWNCGKEREKHHRYCSLCGTKL